jgi:hypothetical protein
MRWIPAAATAVALVAATAPAVSAQVRDPADPGANLPRAGEPPRAEPRTGHRPVPERIDATLRFTSRERDLFKSWAIAEYGRGKCPPGLAKKEDGCLPRGAPRKRYMVGLALPPSTVIAPVPLDLTGRVGTPAVGYRYGMIDGDLVKLDLARGIVLDAIDGYVPK